MNEPWTSTLRDSIPNVEMRAEFRDQLRYQLIDAWEQPTVAARSRGRLWAAAAAAVLTVGLIAALMVERSRNDDARVVGPSPRTEPVSSAESSSPTAPGSQRATAESAPTAPISATAETEGPMSTNVDNTSDRPEGAVPVEQPELPASALFQAVVSEEDRVVTLEVTTMRTYDPADPCTRYYEVDLTESAERVMIDLVPFRPPGEAPQGCRAVGERRQFVVALGEPLGRREVLFQGQVIDLLR